LLANHINLLRSNGEYVTFFTLISANGHFWAGLARFGVPIENQLSTFLKDQMGKANKQINK